MEGTGKEFKIVLTRKGHLDEAAVRVEYDALHFKDVPPEELPARLELLQKQVAAKLKNATQIRFDVEIIPPYTLERAISKAKRVIDNRPAQAV